MINLTGIEVKFGDFTALKDINIHVQEGQFYTFLGPSGCGKTTTLRTITGFIKPTQGRVVVKGKDITDMPVEKRNIGMVFQNYALFPTMSVYENIAFGLRVNKVNKTDIDRRVREMGKKVELSDKQLIRKVAELSGGQQQRVAIARALVNRPRVLLLDEPLGALDLKLRKDMQNELKNIQRTTGITFIYVTHDQEEALSMSDTVVVMAEGRIQQIGTPVDIYNEPINAFVADFIGESNIVDGVMKEDFVVSFSGHTFDCVDKGFAKGEPVDVVIRPEDVDVVPVEKGMLSGKVFSVTFKGDYYEIIVDVAGFKWMLETSDYVGEGQVIGLHIEPDAIHVMKRSKFSDTFGDYSTFSEEMEHLSDVTGEDEQE